MQAKAPILAIDGNNIAHRVYHRAKHFGTDNAAGEFANTLRMLQAATTERYGRAPITVVAFDCPGDYVRDSWCPTYKDGRAAKDPEVQELLETLPLLCASAGIRALVVDGWEADDITASLAVLAERTGRCAVIATSDKDALGRVTDYTAVHRIHAGQKSVWVTPDVFEAEYGFSASRYLEFAALRGDSSDNLPGVTGIGPKRASALINNCDDVVAAITDGDDISEWVGKKAASAAVAERDRFLLNIKMMRLKTDLDLNLNEPDSTRLLNDYGLSDKELGTWQVVAA